VTSGVRYVCDILSTVLFTVFINLIIVRQKDRGWFRLCYALNSMYIGCIMYAGDIILLSATAVHSKVMVLHEGEDLGVPTFFEI